MFFFFVWLQWSVWVCLCKYLFRIESDLYAYYFLASNSSLFSRFVTSSAYFLLLIFASHISIFSSLHFSSHFHLSASCLSERKISPSILRHSQGPGDGDETNEVTNLARFIDFNISNLHTNKVSFVSKIEMIFWCFSIRLPLYSHIRRFSCISIITQMTPAAQYRTRNRYTQNSNNLSDFTIDPWWNNGNH